MTFTFITLFYTLTRVLTCRGNNYSTTSNPLSTNPSIIYTVSSTPNLSFSHMPKGIITTSFWTHLKNTPIPISDPIKCSFSIRKMNTTRKKINGSQRMIFLESYIPLILLKISAWWIKKTRSTINSKRYTKAEDKNLHIWTRICWLLQAKTTMSLQEIHHFPHFHRKTKS